MKLKGHRVVKNKYNRKFCYLCSSQIEIEEVFALDTRACKHHLCKPCYDERLEKNLNYYHQWYDETHRQAFSDGFIADLRHEMEKST